MRGILYVESRPSDPQNAAEYHAFYEAHLCEMVSVDGFVSARRFEPFEHDGPFIAVYEIEADDLPAARAKLAEALAGGKVTRSETVQTHPPPTVRYFREISAYPRRMT